MVVAETATTRISPTIGFAGVGEGAGVTVANDYHFDVDEIGAVGVGAGGDAVFY